MDQRSYSTIGGFLGIITFLILVAGAFADNPEANWTIGSSPLVPAIWITLLGILVVLLSRTAMRRILPLRILGMWAFGVMLGGIAAAVILGFRGEWNLAWKMLVLGASGWLAQFLVGIPYRSEQDSAIHQTARQLRTTPRQVAEFFCSRLATAGGDPEVLALSVTDDPRVAPLEHATIDEVVADHCPEYQQVWEAAKRILRYEREHQTSGGGTLIENLIANPSMESDEIRAAMGRQQESSDRFLSAASTSWPDRNEYGWPALTAEVKIWLKEQRGWEPASLEASLSPGMMTASPNLMFRVEMNATDDFIWSQSVYLLPRPDLSQDVPSYELRWTDPKTYQQNQAAISSESANLALLADYLDGHWAGASSDPVMQKFLAPEPSVFPPEAPQP